MKWNWGIRYFKACADEWGTENNRAVTVTVKMTEFRRFQMTTSFVFLLQTGLHCKKQLMTFNWYRNYTNAKDEQWK